MTQLPQYVLGFMFSQCLSEVLLIHKKRPAWQAGRLNGVGGHIEKGESPLEAMRRECKEETGIDYNDWKMTTILNDKRGYPVYVFSGVTDLTKARSITDEHVVPTYVRTLPNVHCIPNLRWLVPMALTLQGPEERAMFFVVEEK